MQFALSALPAKKKKKKEANNAIDVVSFQFQ